MAVDGSHSGSSIWPLQYSSVLPCKKNLFGCSGLRLAWLIIATCKVKLLLTKLHYPSSFLLPLKAFQDLLLTSLEPNAAITLHSSAGIGVLRGFFVFFFPRKYQPTSRMCSSLSYLTHFPLWVVTPLHLLVAPPTLSLSLKKKTILNIIFGTFYLWKPLTWKMEGNNVKFKKKCIWNIFIVLLKHDVIGRFWGLLCAFSGVPESVSHWWDDIGAWPRCS